MFFFFIKRQTNRWRRAVRSVLHYTRTRSNDYNIMQCIKNILFDTVKCAHNTTRYIEHIVNFNFEFTCLQIFISNVTCARRVFRLEFSLLQESLDVYLWHAVHMCASVYELTFKMIYRLINNTSILFPEYIYPNNGIQCIKNTHFSINV